MICEEKDDNGGGERKEDKEGQSFDNRREDELKDKGAEFIQLNRSSPQNGTFLHVKYSVFKGAEKK